MIDRSAILVLLGRLPGKLLRLAAVVLLLGMGWFTLTTFAELLQKPSDPPRPTANTASFLDEYAAEEVPPGGWSFSGKSNRMEICGAAQLDERLGRLPEGTVAGSMEEGLVKLFVRSPATKQFTEERFVVYRSEHEGWRACFFALAGPPEGRRWVLGRIAVPVRDDLWLIQEILPLTAQADAQPGQSGAAALLPLPRQAMVLASRHDGAGRIFGQIVRWGRSQTELVDFWRQQGGSLSGKLTDGTAVCCLGGVCVRAWVPSVRGEKSELVFLIRAGR